MRTLSAGLLAKELASRYRKDCSGENEDVPHITRGSAQGGRSRWSKPIEVSGTGCTALSCAPREKPKGKTGHWHLSGPPTGRSLPWEALFHDGLAPSLDVALQIALALEESA